MSRTITRYLVICAFAAALAVVIYARYSGDGGEARLISQSEEVSSPGACEANIKIDAQKFVDRRPWPNPPGWEIFYKVYNDPETTESKMTGAETMNPYPSSTFFFHSGHDPAESGGCSMHFLALYEALPAGYTHSPVSFCNVVRGDGVIAGFGGRINYFEGTVFPPPDADLLCTFYNDTACYARVADEIYDDAIYDPIDPPYLHASFPTPLNDPPEPRPFRRIFPYFPSGPSIFGRFYRQPWLVINSGSDSDGALLPWLPMPPGGGYNWPPSGFGSVWVSGGPEYHSLNAWDTRRIGFNNVPSTYITGGREGFVWLEKREGGLHIHSPHAYDNQTLSASLPYEYDILTIDDGEPNPPPIPSNLPTTPPWDNSFLQTGDHHLVAITSAAETQVYRWQFTADPVQPWGVVANQGEFQSYQPTFPGGDIVELFDGSDAKILAVGSSAAAELRIYGWDSSLGPNGQFVAAGTVSATISPNDRLIGYKRGETIYILHSKTADSATDFYRWNGVTLTLERTISAATILHAVTVPGRSYFLTAEGPLYIWESNQGTPGQQPTRTFPPAYDWSSFVWRGGEQFIVQATEQNGHDILLFYRIGQCAIGSSCFEHNPANCTPGPDCGISYVRDGLCVDGAGNTDEPPPLTGDADVNDDCRVDNLDYNIISTNQGNLFATHAEGDANLDGVVDQADLDLWTAQQGITVPNCPATQCGNGVCETGEDEILQVGNDQCMMACPQDCPEPGTSSSSSSASSEDSSAEQSSSAFSGHPAAESSSSIPVSFSSRSRFSDWDICTWPGN